MCGHRDDSPRESRSWTKMQAHITNANPHPVKLRLVEVRLVKLRLVAL